MTTRKPDLVETLGVDPQVGQLTDGRAFVTFSPRYFPRQPNTQYGLVLKEGIGAEQAQALADQLEGLVDFVFSRWIDQDMDGLELVPDHPAED